jgi:prepilin-type N-terminal cleavage/methylation domain-containing protein
MTRRRINLDRGAPRRRSERPARSARGMTFLEVVFAVAILGLLASTLIGAANYMMGRQRYEQRTLASMELANRLILQFLDDRDAMPDPAEPLFYGGDEFRWNLVEVPLTFRPTKPPPVREGSRASTAFDNFRMFTVRVWLSNRSGGSVEPSAAVPHAAVSRMYDYKALWRNPDTLEYLLKSDAGRRRLMDDGSTAPMGLPGRSGERSGSDAGKSRTSPGKDRASPTKGGR